MPRKVTRPPVAHKKPKKATTKLEKPPEWEQLRLTLNGVLMEFAEQIEDLAETVGKLKVIESRHDAIVGSLDRLNGSVATLKGLEQGIIRATINLGNKAEQMALLPNPQAEAIAAAASRLMDAADVALAVVDDDDAAKTIESAGELRRQRDSARDQLGKLYESLDRGPLSRWFLVRLKAAIWPPVRVGERRG